MYYRWDALILIIVINSGNCTLDVINFRRKVYATGLISHDLKVHSPHTDILGTDMILSLSEYRRQPGDSAPNQPRLNHEQHCNILPAADKVKTLKLPHSFSPLMTTWCFIPPCPFYSICCIHTSCLQGRYTPGSSAWCTNAALVRHYWCLVSWG